MSPPRIWIDIEDVLIHLNWWGRPSGIQRLTFEAARALVEIAGEDRIRFLRHSAGDVGFREITFAELSEVYMASVTSGPGVGARPQNTAARAAEASVDPAEQVPTGLRRIWHRLASSLQADVRAAVLNVLLLQWATFKAVPKVVRTLRQVRRRARRGPSGSEAESMMQPGDVVFGLAAPWSDYHMARVEELRRGRGLRYATLVYDLIPLVRPEFSGVSVSRRFRAWAERMLPAADVTMAISHATRRDIEALAMRHGFSLRAPVRVTPLGTGFPSIPAAPGDRTAVPDEPYVVCVSTLEVRKNHLLLFRVWRRLVDSMPAGQVPLLVLAGSLGWLVDDLMQQMRNTGFLDGRIRIVESPSDGQLEALYRGAMFSIYPSHYEGWGLPVVESMAFGTPCLSADGSSLPEAGGDLARYFPADDVGAATREVRRLIDDPAELARWREEVRTRFRPVAWRETAAAMLAAIDGVAGEGVKGGSLAAAMDGPPAAV